MGMVASCVLDNNTRLIIKREWNETSIIRSSFIEYIIDSSVGLFRELLWEFISKANKMTFDIVPILQVIL